MTCCAYSCTQYGLHTQYMLLTHADDLPYLQLHTLVSIFSWTCKVFTLFITVNTVNEPELDTNRFSENRYNDIKLDKLSNYMTSSHFWFWKRSCRDIFGEGESWLCLSYLLKCDCITNYKTAVVWVCFYYKEMNIFEYCNWKHGLSRHPNIWPDPIYKYM